jgi:hypothetical protein
MPKCATPPLETFMVELSDHKTRIAEGAALTDDGVIHLDIFEPWTQAHGERGTVSVVRKEFVCREDARRPIARLPRSFCQESRQLAVAFDYNAPLSNKILTNGFSFVLRSAGRAPKDFNLQQFSEEVRKGFSRAIGLWVSALSDHKELLTPTVQAFVDGRTMKSNNGYSLQIPPQVVRLDCPHSATFVVELTFSGKLFPTFPLALARARVEGRTIALNLRDFRFRSELDFKNAGKLRFKLDDGAINLLPILTHELGHAFGLNHSDVAEKPALMDSMLSHDALVPMPQDVGRFVKLLDTSIVGARPGVLEMVSSAGVRPPRDYQAERDTQK